ncbi:MAG: hypothetical protein RLZZ488_221 [Pseudomonadota bacterium]|jgi:hypothetical protein
MNQSIARYLLPVLKRRLEMELQRWSSALESGFDVVLVVQEEALAETVAHFLTTDDFFTMRSPCQIVVYDLQGQCVQSMQKSAHLKADPNRVSLPTLSLVRESPHPVCGSIPFELPPLQSLFPSAAQMVSLVLERANLSRYMDAFDGKKMTALRKILDVHGHELFFDSIVQVAYRSGFRGEDEGATEFLESRLSQPPATTRRRIAARETAAAEEKAHAVAGLFDRVLRCNDPHDALKASLTHYVFHGRRVTQAEASRILKVSRSTLQAHLQLAELLNVAELFTESTPSA